MTQSIDILTRLDHYLLLRIVFAVGRDLGVLVCNTNRESESELDAKFLARLEFESHTGKMGHQRSTHTTLEKVLDLVT